MRTKSWKRYRGHVPMTVAVLATGLLPTLDRAEIHGQTPIDLPASDRPLRVALDEVYRLGGLDVEGWQALQNVRDVGFDGRGLLHVLDQGTGVVHVIGPDGSRLRGLGGEGDGPGEISAAVGMAVAPDGTVLVEDLGRRSLAVFGPDGAYLRNAAPDGSRGRIGSFAVDGRHRLVGLASVVFVGRPGSGALRVMILAEGGSIEDPPGLPLLRADLNGGQAERLRWNWLPEREAEDGRPRETAFLPRVRWGLLPDGRVAVVDSVDYRVRVVGGGDEVVIRRPLPVRETRAADRRAELERRAAEDAKGGAARGGAMAGVGENRDEATAAMRRQRRSALEQTLAFYPELQVVRALEVDDDGRMWIERVGEDVTEPGPVDVVTSDGRYLGTVPPGGLTLPDAFGPGGLAVWVERDDLDVPVIVVRRLSLQGGS